MFRSGRFGKPAFRPATVAGWFLLSLGCWDLAIGTAAEEAPREFSRGVLIRFEGEINPMLQQYLYRKLDEAKAADADVVIVEIDSPGGYVIESLDIAKRLRDLPWAHTVAYVPDMALSGAAIVALGCDEIIMDPKAMLGDAGPIFQDEHFQFRHAPEKVRSHLAAEVRELAKSKGRPTALAEAMVDRDLLVYRYTNVHSREVVYRSEDEVAADPNPDQWEQGELVHESRKDAFLEASGQRAVELGLADGTATDRQALAQRYRLGDNLTVVEWGGVDTVVMILNTPLVTVLLFVVGLVALYIEFSAPGISIGGLTAGLCFSLFFWSRFLGGTAGWLEVVLFAAGVVFLLIELFVLPGFGVAGLTGFLLLIISLVLAGQNFILPETSGDLDTLTSTLLVVATSGLAFFVAAFVLSSYFGAIPLLNSLALKPPEPESPDAPDQAARTSSDVMAEGIAGLRVGERGVAESLLRPAGKVRFGSRPVDVVADGSFITPGCPVEVVEISGNRVVVRQIEETVGD
ncbi:MAG: peptidase [Planctomycetes bacterium]|nr:peptidase [Planctomycetota bacterium]